MQASVLWTTSYQLFANLLNILKRSIEKMKFLAVQNSSIGDLVTESVSEYY